MSTLSLRPLRLPAPVAVAALLAGFILAAPARAHDPTFGVDPVSVEVSLDPGASTDVAKTVHTPEILPTPDIYFLADSTGSMGAVINNVKADAASVLAAVDGLTNDPRYGAGDYKDFQVPQFDPYAFQNGAAIPATDDDGAAALGAIGAWSASGGVDGSEAQLFALHRIAAHGDAAFRTDSSRIVVWFGDAPGHDPVCDEISGDTGHDVTEASVTAELVSEEVRVIAISTTTGFPAALDDDPVPAAFGYAGTCAIGGTAGQATRITAATGGVHLTGVAPSDIADAILAGLGALEVEVTPEATCDDPSVTISWDAASKTVTSGDDALFTETIAASLAAPQGDTVECTVEFLVDGQLLEGFTQTVTVHINDVTAPDASCVEGTNPHGKTVPEATNQNPDGFYLLSAEDILDPDPEIFVVDSESGEVFGPFESGTTIKYTEANGAPPGQKTIGSSNGQAGAVMWHLTGQGDALVVAVDSSGNASDAVACLVPPPPR
jgi:hypothetical protein